MSDLVRYGLMICLAGSWGIAAPALKPAPQKVTPSVVGEWEDEAGRRWLFTEDGLFLRAGETAGPKTTRYAVDPTKVPAEFDIIHPATRNGTFHGIYKVERDTLTYAVSGVGLEARPTRFERSDDPYVVMQVYKRVKPKD
jgi:uncharacterized protein (TIGR03067 family)